MSLLSDLAIEAHLRLGTIVIEPFKPERLNTDSYDLELGPYFWRYVTHAYTPPYTFPRYLDPTKVSRHDDSYKDAYTFHDASSDGYISLDPGERILGHTVEVAGGCSLHGEAVTTQLQATSTAARHGVSVCDDAGWGDVGYVGIWTLELTNRTKSVLRLPVGALIAQIAFTKVDKPTKDYKSRGGQYQEVSPHIVVDEIRAAWEPKHMLPGPMKVADTWKTYFPKSWPNSSGV